jgi:hypothetical protein
MKLQISLVTLLVCMTVLAVVLALCTTIMVPAPKFETVIFESGRSKTVPVQGLSPHRPNFSDVCQRAEWAAPLSLFVTATTILAIRRLKSRRHTEPPVG